MAPFVLMRCQTTVTRCSSRLALLRFSGVREANMSSTLVEADWFSPASRRLPGEISPPSHTMRRGLGSLVAGTNLLVFRLITLGDRFRFRLLLLRGEVVSGGDQ